MRAGLSSAQRELRRDFAEVLGGAASTEELRARCDARGWTRLTADVRSGGLGLGEAEAVLLAEELGASAKPADLVGQILAHDEPDDDSQPARGWLRHSAYLAGVARTAISLAVARARDRRQFGVPISQFQAVMFPLAEHGIRLQGLRQRIYQLAAEIDAGRELSAEVATLARLADDIAGRAIAGAVHVHGAWGLTDAADVSACYRLMQLAPAPPVSGPPSRSAQTLTPADAAAFYRTALNRRVPAGWVGIAARYPGPACAHQLVAEAARKFPDVPAVQPAGEAALTYQELNQRANRLAHALRRRGVTADTVVGVCLPRGAEMVVALLGVMKAGGAYLPLDPEYPAERLAFMITDARTPLVVTQSSLTEWLPDTPASLLRLDRDEQELLAAPDHDPVEVADASTLAYVIYTSGSTGTPKGVEIEHRGLANRLHWDRETFPLGPEDAVLQHTSLSFDIATLEIFSALISGARLVVAPAGAERDTAALVRVIRAGEVTVLLAVPSVLDVLLEEHPGLAEASRLRYVFSGGEPLPPELCARLFDAVPQAEVHNFYGPSEATIDVTSWHCTPGGISDGVPIGRPLANVRAYLVDDTGAPVAVGAVGELLVGGPGVARGYRFRPELTRERFLPDPFSGEPGARLYRTGDLARYRQDGAIEFLGRVDEQIKVRGFRVEPGEVESALTRVPTVRQAVVKAVSNMRLEAYVTCFAGQERPTPADLLSALRGRLPAHLVPDSVEIVEEFPRMPNGKIDRAALAPARGRAGDGDESSAMGKVARLMADALNRSGINPDDDFFELGGTSLAAARLVARLRNRFDTEIDLAEFIADPTCAGVTRIVGGEDRGTGP